ncbi:hypothetical protein [Kineococcus rhizosphaerae]|uniref:Dolichyl-phosphate-mannose-protein mannosyltransferase n=1 Tax=Kineococcus rhizosphaerae TaxID=559628 RepID=A0A2T0R6S5_9ACTN|nr:hypothetical protein [Kineococcus rhizosphaerae]PRY16869.1 hypothetical protein CLV37_103301 [Kineococcus rhizosphaerae]
MRPTSPWRALAGLAALSTTFLLVRMLGGGLVGMSDQGDGTRLLCQLGLAQDHPYNTSTRDYLHPVWLSHTWYGEDCGADGEPYRSTQLWFAWVATRLTHLFTPVDGLDLRVMAVLFSVVVGCLVAGLAVLLVRGAGARVLVTAALLLVVGDGAFAGYFASAYSEPAAFVGVLALLVAVILHLRADVVRVPHLLLLAAAAMFTVTTKTQNAAFLPAVLLVLLLRPVGTDPGPPLPRRRRSWRELPGRVRAGFAPRLPALVTAAALVLGSGLYLQAQPQRFTTQNDYAAVFVEMLPHSPDPEADLRALGLPAVWTASSGVPIGAPGSAANSLAFADFDERAGLGSRLGVYARDPQRLLSMAGRGLEAMGVLRADYLYSYPADAGRGPEQQECRVCVLQTVWTTAFDETPDVLLLVLALAVAACVVLAWTARHSPRARAAGGAGVFLAVGAAGQFWVALLTDGASDLIKHLVVADFCVALVFATTVAAVLAVREDTREPVV